MELCTEPPERRVGAIATPFRDRQRHQSGMAFVGKWPSQQDQRVRAGTGSACCRRPHGAPWRFNGSYSPLANYVTIASEDAETREANDFDLAVHRRAGDRLWLPDPGPGHV